MAREAGEMGGVFMGCSGVNCSEMFGGTKRGSSRVNAALQTGAQPRRM
jgi:hypothetical protein